MAAREVLRGHCFHGWWDPFTVEKTRNSSHDELFALGYERLRAAMRTGTTHMEGKSGYGLSTETELKLLDVMDRLNGVGHLPSIDPVDGCPRHAIGYSAPCIP